MANSVQFERSAPQLAREFEDKVEKLIATENGPTPPELEKICDLLDVFQELPQILDTSLEKTVTQLARRSLNTKETWPFRILYSLCKVRGHKIVSRFLPSEGMLIGSFAPPVVDTHHSRQSARNCRMDRAKF